MAVQEAAGLAALSICESLMIVLVEKGLLSAEEARETLEDAAAAHHEGEPEGEPAARIAAQIIERLVTQVNAAVRSPVGGAVGGAGKGKTG